MQANALFEFLHDQFLAHPDHAVERFTVRGNERFLVGLEDKRVTFLRIEQGEPLLFFFWTMQDLRMFRTVPGLERSPYGRMFEVPGLAYNLNFDRAVGVDPSLIEPQALFEALTQIASQSSMRKLLPRTDDSLTVTRLREYYFSDGEWEYQYALDKLVEHIDETNLDYAIECISAIDPWIDEDPDHALGTTLILLDDLVRDHQRCVAQSYLHLKRLQEAYRALGPKAKHDLAEVDYLLDLVSRQMN